MDGSVARVSFEHCFVLRHVAHLPYESDDNVSRARPRRVFVSPLRFPAHCERRLPVATDLVFAVRCLRRSLVVAAVRPPCNFLDVCAARLCSPRLPFRM